jgi:large subunit ribosomal protein L17
MRHGKKVAHLGRTNTHRKAMLANMASSLIEHKRINTTVAKAKALKQFVEPLVTRSKEDTTHNRRIVFRALRNKYAVTELFRIVSEKVGNRPGGYTRIIKLGNRLGDNADMALIELVDFNDVYETDKPKKKKSRRRGAKKAAPAKEVAEGITEETPVTDEAPAEVAADAAVAEDVSSEEATEEAADESASSEEENKAE